MTTLATITIPAKAERHPDKIRITTSTENAGDMALFSPGNHVFAAHATGMGTINLHSFKIEEVESVGINVAETERDIQIIIKGDTMILPSGTDIVRIYDITGRIIGSLIVSGTTLSTESLPAGISIIEATGAYGRSYIKISR